MGADVLYPSKKLLNICLDKSGEVKNAINFYTSDYSIDKLIEAIKNEVSPNEMQTIIVQQVIHEFDSLEQFFSLMTALIAKQGMLSVSYYDMLMLHEYYAVHSQDYEALESFLNRKLCIITPRLVALAGKFSLTHKVEYSFNSPLTFATFYRN